MSTSLSSAPQSNTSGAEAPAAPLASTQPPALAVVSVLASGLPPELGTPEEPALYTVPAVFSRRVTPQERARIEDPTLAARLMGETGAGPGLELTVSDRRLLISNTNLSQLQAGLATAIGQMLNNLGKELRAARAERASAAEVRMTDERQRAGAVARIAAEIRFGPTEDPADPEAPRAT